MQKPETTRPQKKKQLKMMPMPVKLFYFSFNLPIVRAAG
jgi:hypothetical protein